MKNKQMSSAAILVWCFKGYIVAIQGTYIFASYKPKEMTLARMGFLFYLSV